MNLKRLLDEGRIEAIQKEEFDCKSALKDISSAENSLSSLDFNWSDAISYNAVLRVSRNMMQSLGYRAIGREHHRNVFVFLEEIGFDKELTDFFDKIRKKRNLFLYGEFDGSSEESAKEVLAKAKEFVRKMRTFVRKSRTGVKK